MTCANASSIPAAGAAFQAFERQLEEGGNGDAMSPFLCMFKNCIARSAKIEQSSVFRHKKDGLMGEH
jgi:hypothetical protein